MQVIREAGLTAVQGKKKEEEEEGNAKRMAVERKSERSTTNHDGMRAPLTRRELDPC